MKTSAPETQEGKIVSVTGDQLKWTCDKGNEHNHTIAKDARVTCDGLVGKTTDLKAGAHIRVTTHKDDQSVATAIECKKAASSTPQKA